MRKTRYPGIMRLQPNTYRIRARAYDPRTGKRKEKDKIVHNISLADAVKLRQQWMVDIENGGRETPTRTTLKAYARSWIASRTARLAHSTASRYATALDLHIVPDLGAIYLDAVTKQDVELWLLEQGRVFPAVTANGWLRILKALFADASEDFGFPNPAIRVKALEDDRPDEDPNSLSEKELKLLLDAFRQHQPQFYPLVLTLALTGLRWGEATALKWSDLDQERGVIHVRRAHWRGRLKKLKNKRPRTAPLPPVLFEVLTQWQVQLEEAQHPGQKQGWCFPSRKGTPRTSNVMTKPMRDCLERAKIDKRVTMQGLRRSAEDVLRRLGVSGPLAEALMGHNARMRSHYSTVADHEVANVGDRVAQAVFGDQVGGEVGGSAAEQENAPLLN